jgi:hypothetical protein
MLIPAAASFVDFDPTTASNVSYFTSGGPYTAGVTLLKEFSFNRSLTLYGMAAKRPSSTISNAPDLRPRLYSSTGTLLASGSSSTATYIGTPAEIAAGTFMGIPFDSSFLVPANTPVWFGFWLVPPIYVSSTQTSATNFATDVANYSPGSTLTNARDGVVATCSASPRSTPGDVFPSAGGAAPISADPIYLFAAGDSVGILLG